MGFPSGSPYAPIIQDIQIDWTTAPLTLSVGAPQRGDHPWPEGFSFYYRNRLFFGMVNLLTSTPSSSNNFTFRCKPPP